MRLPLHDGQTPCPLREKATRPGANGLVEFSPFEFLDRLADLVPPPRKHRRRYYGVFAPNHRLRKAVTALAIGNVSKQREATTGGDGNDGRATGGCCDANPNQKPRSHDTSRIAWAKLMARVGEEFPLERPACGGDIRLIAFITEPGPIRKILTHLGEPLEPPPIRSPGNGKLGRGLRRRKKNTTAGGCAAFWRTVAGRPTRPISLLKDSPSAGRPLRKCH